MKQCPKCFQSYDDSESFCQNDGSSLAITSTEQEIYSSANTPTVVLTKYPTGHTGSPPVKQTSPILYAVIGGMGVLILCLVGFLLFARNSTESDTAKKSEVNSANKNDETAKSNDATNSQQSLAASNSPAVAKPIDVPVPTPPPPPFTSPSGTWQGQWTNGKGSVFGQQLTLRDGGNGRLSGQVIHTLQQTVNPQKMDKIGLTAVEYVQGNYDPKTKMINLSGVRKNDPNNIIILDKYRLSISADDSTIAGATVGGRSGGRISLRK